MSCYPPLCTVLDVCCASGRDLVTFTQRGHRATGLDGVPAFCELARKLSGCEVLEQDLTRLDLPKAAYDGIFANACLFHVPSAALPRCLEELTSALKPGGVLFVSNAHGFGQDREGYTNGRTPSTQRYVVSRAPPQAETASLPTHCGLLTSHALLTATCAG